MSASSRATLALALVLAYPSGASTSSIAPCRTRDLSGLSAPWAGTGFSQPDDAALWSIESGRLKRVPAIQLEPVGLGNGYLRSVLFVTPEVGWVVGAQGTIGSTRDGGRNWTDQSIPSGDGLRAISCVDDQQCWVLGDEGTLLTTQNGGKEWRRSRPERTFAPTDIFFLDEQRGWIADGDTYLETRDGGEHWQRMPAPQPINRTPLPRCDMVRFVDATHGWIAAGDRLLATTDGGETWAVSLQLPAGFDVFVVTQKGSRVHVATEGSCDLFSREGVNYSSDDGGRTWTADLHPDGGDEDARMLDDRPALPLRRLTAPLVLDGRRDSWDAQVFEIYAQGHVARSRRSHIVRHETCGDVEIETEDADLGTSLGAWIGAADPCRLDPERVNAVLARLPVNSVERQLVAECGTVTKVFRFDPWVHRQRLARTYPSLVGLIELTDRVREGFPRRGGSPEARRRAGVDIAAQLAAGLYDSAFDEPGNVRALLNDYEGALPPKGLRGRVAADLPEGVRFDSYVEPRYPEIALAARVTGTLTLELEVDGQTGIVDEVKLATPFPLLQEATVSAATQWRFALDNLPANMPIRVTVRFSIDPCVRGGTVDPW